MIPYPTTETVLAKHGNTAAGRARARKAIVSAIHTQGDELIDYSIAAAGRSMKCSGWISQIHGGVTPRHHGDPDGCKNDGRTCICECHDPAA